MVTSVHDNIIAFNTDTGEKLWSHPQTNEPNIHPNTPIYSDDMIFSTTSAAGSIQLRLNDGGRSVEQVWENNELDNLMGNAVMEATASNNAKTKTYEPVGSEHDV